MTRSWYEIQAKAGSADIYIYDTIGEFGVRASDFVKELQGLRGRTLNIFVNSPGGEAFDAMAIYQALRRHDAPVHTMVDSIAASAASLVVQAGTTRTMAKPATMMIHDPYGGALGDASTMESMADMLNKVGDQIAGVYADRAGGTVEEWRQRMLDTTWYKAAEAQEAGLADNVADAVPIAAEYKGRVFNLSKFNNVPDWVQQDDNSDPDEPDTEPDNTDTEEESMSDLTAVRAALGLNDEGDPIAAINALREAAKDISTGEKGAENALRKENAQLRQQILTVESDYGQRILALEDRNRQKEAAYAVDSAIQQGRVAPKDREIALKLALNDADGFAQFASNLRVDLSERGMAMDATMAELEPTAEEVRIAASMGVTREQLMAQKAADKGIKLPA